MIFEKVGRANVRPWMRGEIDVPADLGADLGAYKWRQNQTYVEVFVLLPPHCAGSRHVDVTMTSDSLDVHVCGDAVLSGELFAPIKAEASTWLISDGILELSLLKRNRRGNYENGCSNADTFWFGVLRGERLALDQPPPTYYDCEWVREPEGSGPGYKARGGSNKPMVSGKRR